MRVRRRHRGRRLRDRAVPNWKPGDEIALGGQRNLTVTANTNTHVLTDKAELVYDTLLT